MRWTRVDAYRVVGTSAISGATLWGAFLGGVWWLTLIFVALALLLLHQQGRLLWLRFQSRQELAHGEGFIHGALHTAVGQIESMDRGDMTLHQLETREQLLGQLEATHGRMSSLGILDHDLCTTWGEHGR